MELTQYTGTSAIWLNVLTIGVMTFFITNLSVSVVVSILNQGFLNILVKPRKAVLWLLVLLPWLSAGLIAGTFLNSYLGSNPFELSNSFAHWHHMDEFDLINWHGATLLAFLSLLTYVLVHKARQFIKHQRQLNLLTSLSEARHDNVYQIPSPEVFAFTSGLFRRRCFITSGMIEQTNEQEREVILRHEQAHARMYDPLKKWLFSLLSLFFLPSLAKRLKLHMTLAMEQDADDQVLSEHLNPTIVASTLVKVARLNAGSPMMASNDLVAAFGADVLEQRVYFLLGQLQLKPVNLLLTSVFVGLIFVISLSSIDGIHHLMEALFSR